MSNFKSYYSKIHPLITPEYYKLYPHHNNNVIKAFYVPADSTIPPTILTNTATKILSYTFPSDHYELLHINDKFHIYHDPFFQINFKSTNLIITSYLRNIHLTTYGEKMTTSIYGNVVIFGSTNLFTNTLENKNHSVPYYVVEELIALYSKEQIL
jgi:hypothetical protein